MEIVVPYNLLVINIVTSFIEETGVCYGADNHEKIRLRLLAEEAFTFILNGIPHVEFDEMFHLRTFEEENNLGFRFSNHGRPMDVRDVPEFSMDDPSGTADGLSLKLMKNLCDELVFHNLGKQGWELLLRVSFKNYQKMSFEDIQASKMADRGAVGNLIFRRATKEDAPGIVNLVYNTYRYTYGNSILYDKDMLSEAIEVEKIYSFVALTNEGKVVGHNAIRMESPLLGEMGMAMIDPEIRGGNVFMSLKNLTLKVVLDQCPNILIFVEAVTSHKMSQAFAVKFTPCLVHLSFHLHTSFIGLNEGKIDRESLIVCISNKSNYKIDETIYVPNEHYDIINGIFCSEVIPVKLESNNLAHAQKESEFSLNLNIERKHATLCFTSFGQEAGTLIKQHARSIQQEGIVTSDIMIPTDQNQPINMDQVLLDNGYFFCGIQPNPDGSWGIVYTNLLNQKFDFDKLQLFSPKTVALCNYVRTQYQKSF